MHKFAHTCISLHKSALVFCFRMCENAIRELRPEFPPPFSWTRKDAFTGVLFVSEHLTRKGSDDVARLTKKNEVFCKEYLIDLNATQAAIRAGYSVDSAGSIGSELLKKPEIRARVEKEMADRSKRVGINADRVLRELGRIAFVNPDDLIDLSTATVKPGASPDDLSAIAGVKVKYVPHKDFDENGDPVVEDAIEREVRLHDKLKALKLCGRHLGMFKDDPTATAPVTVVINYDYGDRD